MSGLKIESAALRMDPPHAVTFAQVGHPAPHFEMFIVSSDETDARLRRLADGLGTWQILLFYPRDFSFVCPTELTAFSARIEEFRLRDCDVLGVSVDSIEMHREWLSTPPREGGLGPLRYPLAADPVGEVARRYGVWDAEKEVALRGLFIIDPQGVLQYSVVHNLSVGRSTDEILRVIDALQAGGLCPAGWTRADGQLDPESLLRPGTALGHYRIRKQLGAGSFGNVFEAWDSRLERPVALKILHANGAHARSVAMHEARAAARLNHPNVCTIYSVDEEDGLPMIAMELLDGPSLAVLLSQRPLDESQMLQLMQGLAAGAAAAHQQGILHGDLKPANIVVGSNGQPKILDFGLSTRRQSTGAFVRPAASDGHGDLSHAYADSTVLVAAQEDGQFPTISGTPAYMSPEQATGQAAGPASDVFALGLIFYELVTGRRGLDDSSPVAIVVRLQNDDIATDLNAQLPARWQPLITPMLDRFPANRPEISKVVEQLS
ncbi:protein kinase domain-containing protein [Planctomicrobium piriforme]|uniref:Alkyl hydroperoxide reductase C n=1 Tax=Planctomicrobium piriforme TaxID=1576369 RepID=A0A1I3RKM0_9PLAN|nr:redoxin domain-containing protein [Planctomicrobium piriforme]SFJ47133.1 Alkyl hydroperoxide reductase subunit AhpC (peroxiredoxin) [Planctomicrobium piriforme]